MSPELSVTAIVEVAEVYALQVADTPKNIGFLYEADFPTGTVMVSVINSVISIPYSINSKASPKEPLQVKLIASGPIFFPHASTCPPASPEKV